jgi:hypothetical protein
VQGMIKSAVLSGSMFADITAYSSVPMLDDIIRPKSKDGQSTICAVITSAKFLKDVQTVVPALITMLFIVVNKNI